MNKRLLRKHKGAALLVALGLIFMFAAATVAMLATATLDRQSADAFSASNETRTLATTAVNLAKTQIRQATLGYEPGNTGNLLAWASQPGMIHTYDQSDSGRPLFVYKLYTSDEMVVDNYDDEYKAEEVDSMLYWDSQPAHFVNLNAPAVVDDPDAGQRVIFPIADPRAYNGNASDPVVEGFSYTKAGPSIEIPGVLEPGEVGGIDEQRLPMPVRWLYVLKDGTLLAPERPTGATTVATFADSSAFQGGDNPIVGRIAFWADDETAKLNINTASEGTFWDAPKSSSLTDKRLSVSMPVGGEFQRIAGHPSTTSLSPVLGSIESLEFPASITHPASLFLESNFANLYANQENSAFYETMKRYFDLTPRINYLDATGTDTTSQAGVRRTTQTGFSGGGNDTVHEDVWPDPGPAPLAWPVVFDADRLYASTSEFIYAPDRQANADMDASDVARRSFFLSTSSRAPEVNLFNEPRIALWPVNTDTNAQTVKDRLIAFCAQLGSDTDANPAAYYFQRSIGPSVFDDDVPADSETIDVGINRNGDLFAYLTRTLSNPVPGYGESFARKWGSAGIDSVLAQTFDLVRANINDAIVVSRDDAGTPIDAEYVYSAYPEDPLSPDIRQNGDGRYAHGWSVEGPGFHVVPSVRNNQRGMGKYITFTDAALVFAASQVQNYDKNGTPMGVGRDTDPGEVNEEYGKILTQETTQVQAMLILQPFFPSIGSSQMFPAFDLEIEGTIPTDIGTFSINGTTRIGRIAPGYTHSGSNYPMPSPQTMFLTYDPNDDNWETKTPGNADTYRGYPAATVNLGAPYPQTFSMTGSAEFTVTIYNLDGEMIQTFDFSFEQASNLPVPQHISDAGLFGITPKTPPGNQRFKGEWQQSNAGNNLETRDNYLDYWEQGEEFDRANSDGDFLGLERRTQNDGNGHRFTKGFIRPGDVVLGLRFDPGNAETGGDYRILALTKEVPASWFIKHNEYPGGGFPLPFEMNEDVNGNIVPINLAQATTNRYGLSFRSVFTANNHAPQNYSFGWRPGNTGLDIRRLTDAFNAASLHTDSGTNADFNYQSIPMIPNGLEKVTLPGASGMLGDWTSGLGNSEDGGFFFRPDNGDAGLPGGGFYALTGAQVGNGVAFEPNRIVPSAGILSGILTTDSSGNLQPWQTLLFNPIPAAGRSFHGNGEIISGTHPGNYLLPDHLYLDNFWMPVVEPFAISETFSTLGKVNLNTEIMPFTYVERTTALRGALKPLLIGFVGNEYGNTNYKWGTFNQYFPQPIRERLHMDETISSFSERFGDGKIFLSATEISEIDLIPDGLTDNESSVDQWWNNRELTSDTLREQPYVALLGRVTTKSNTFTVHYVVQSLQKARSTAFDEWDENADRVVGELEGSTTIERYIDTHNNNIPDYAANPSAAPLSDFYAFRTLFDRQFAP